jgi:hypothetical protein
MDRSPKLRACRKASGWRSCLLLRWSGAEAGAPARRATFVLRTELRPAERLASLLLFRLELRAAWAQARRAATPVLRLLVCEPAAPARAEARPVAPAYPAWGRASRHPSSRRPIPLRSPKSQRAGSRLPRLACPRIRRFRPPDAMLHGMRPFPRAAATRIVFRRTKAICPAVWRRAAGFRELPRPRPQTALVQSKER